MAFRTKSTATRNPHSYEGATIFWHPLLYTQIIELEARCSVRGTLDIGELHLGAAQEAVDAWDEEVLDADDHPIAVPTGSEEERRLQIAHIVAGFPTTLILQLSVLARADNPETARKNLPLIFPENSPSPVAAVSESLPALTAASSAGGMDSVSPAMTEG